MASVASPETSSLIRPSRTEASSESSPANEAVARRNSSLRASRAYPVPPSCVWPEGTASVASGPRPTGRADITLNLDSRSLPPLAVAVPEIKIGKGTRCSAVELRRPKPTIGFEPIPAAYQAKDPSPAHQARPKAVTAPEIKSSSGKRDLNPQGQFLRLIRAIRSTSQIHAGRQCSVVQ